MPCQNNMEKTPATEKINEKARKYHFLPKKIYVYVVKELHGFVLAPILYL